MLLKSVEFDLSEWRNQAAATVDPNDLVPLCEQLCEYAREVNFAQSEELLPDPAQLRRVATLLAEAADVGEQRLAQTHVDTGRLKDAQGCLDRVKNRARFISTRVTNLEMVVA